MSNTAVNLGEYLRTNEYPGRTIIAGKTPSGLVAAAYFIMGRSENSRNRVFTENGDEVIIHPFDPAKAGDPSLIIYSPIRKTAGKLIVTNGNQTDTICNFLDQGKSFEDALETRCFEPDSPNFTPRISAEISLGDGAVKLSILKCADDRGENCNRFCYRYAPVCGQGRMIHTYEHNGNPLPTFEGEPRLVEIPENIDILADLIWSNLNKENKISLYVRYIDVKSGKTENRMYNKNVK